MTWHWRHISDTEVTIRERIARRFRHHVQTPKNPKGRIHREPCVVCKNILTDAHHVDYTQTFKVVWLCFKCHRKVERGRLKITKKMIWDYSSLVITRPGGQRNEKSIMG